MNILLFQYGYKNKGFDTSHMYKYILNNLHFLPSNSSVDETNKHMYELYKKYTIFSTHG